MHKIKFFTFKNKIKILVELYLKKMQGIVVKKNASDGGTRILQYHTSSE